MLMSRGLISALGFPPSEHSESSGRRTRLAATPRRHHLLGRRRPLRWLRCGARRTTIHRAGACRRAAVCGVPSSVGPASAIVLSAMRATIHRTGTGRRAARAMLRRHPRAARLGLGAAVTIQRASHGGRRITIRQPSRSVRCATPSAGCWLCVRTDFCYPKVEPIASKAWN
jgi:hypothetical protein